ncbi:MAG: tyrosine-type recombinase/integrase, partial [Myxococcales bacterium]|nr:tyrosine-type recombinase/integrase [Myxococcales bacterium]
MTKSRVPLEDRTRFRPHSPHHCPNARLLFSLSRAGLGHWAPKDLRDTFASHLLTRGINPAYVSHQLGHADWSVT